MRIRPDLVIYTSGLEILLCYWFFWFVLILCARRVCTAEAAPLTRSPPRVEQPPAAAAWSQQPSPAACPASEKPNTTTSSQPSCQPFLPGGNQSLLFSKPFLQFQCCRRYFSSSSANFVGGGSIFSLFKHKKGVEIKLHLCVLASPPWWSSCSICCIVPVLPNLCAAVASLSYQPGQRSYIPLNEASELASS